MGHVVSQTNRRAALSKQINQIPAAPQIVLASHANDVKSKRGEHRGGWLRAEARLD